MVRFSLLSASLLAAFGLVASASAQAQSNDDRWEISGSYFRPDVRLTGSAQGTVTDGVTTEAAQGSQRASTAVFPVGNSKAFGAFLPGNGWWLATTA